MAKIVLEKVLKQKKISKYEFAKRLHMNVSNVFRFFKDTYDPKFSMIEKWAKVLEVKIKDLYEE